MAISQRASQKKVENKKKKRKMKISKIKKSYFEKAKKEAYPKFVFQEYDKKSVSPKFVEAVKYALGEFDCSKMSCVDIRYRRVLKRIKKYGVEAVMDIPIPSLDDNDQADLFGETQKLLGNWVFTYLNRKGILKSFLPTNDCSFMLSRDWVISFRGLLSRSTPKGLAYYSPKQQIVQIGDEGCIVAYSNHALQRMSERCVESPLSYDASGELFSCLYDKNKLEVCEVFYNQKYIPAIALYRMCTPGYVTYQYVNQVAEDCDLSKVYYRKVGYMPIWTYEGLARGITFLTPGMKGTPEDLLIKSKCNSKEAKELYHGVSKTISFENFIECMDLSTIKWFHENGVKQIAQEF
ncbi:hypothetical protein [Solidesulfovibrio magneticus]|uniref:Uncharacterized protein n=1 Tax=Solidesulfovibrio magneticus (strain ATCC 700980 / DSM 13731 / RS-1) TaxID=573370 RepID=C4XLZ8_SOLM1|nr:hypothetical protein [Solidesulfovibrio magneticus]BAH77126.1 hypothetical protein DMR_36350 [Solidesulfovibrio magneticus RS-1]